MYVELEGFQIRSFHPEDAASLAESANDPRIAANVRDAFPSPYTRGDARNWLASIRGQDPETNFALADGYRVIGGIGLVLGQDVHRCAAEIGYWLTPDRWGQGIATRSVEWLTGHAFEHFELSRVHAPVFEFNAASCRVLEKCGYRLEGRERQAAIKGGKVIDLLVYAVLRDEWGVTSE